MEQIINYRDIPTDKRLDILNALERIGFFPAYGGVKTMQQIMEKSVPGSGPQCSSPRLTKILISLYHNFLDKTIKLRASMTRSFRTEFTNLSQHLCPRAGMIK